VRKPLHRKIRSLSPLKKEEASIPRTDRAKRKELIGLDESLNETVSFNRRYNLFRHGSLGKQNNIYNGQIDYSNPKKQILLENCSIQNNLLGVKNPLEYIWRERKMPSTTKENETRLSKNKFDFSEPNLDSNRYIFSNKAYEEN
jgi:hypothetical protein